MSDAPPPPPSSAPAEGGAPARPWSAAAGAASGSAGQEQRFATLVDAMHDLVFLMAVEPGGVFRCVAVNAAYRRATGLAAEQVVGRTLDEILAEPARSWARARYEDAIARGSAIHYEEDVALAGSRLLLETTLTPILDDAGRCTHLLGAARDATARRDLEERLRQAQKMEAVGRLAGGIAHDFNNLLTAIRCNVQLAADGLPAQHPVLDDVAQIAEAADRASALTRQLLAFSRRQLLQPVPLDLNRVVYDMERMLRRIVTVQGPHITLDTALAHDIRPVLADVVQMQQVLLNLAVNARDAMTDGGALLIATANATVRAPDPHRHGVVPPGEYVTLIVRDTGHGMDDATLDHLFEPFFTTKGAGTGLGLSTVHGIVEQSGGHLVAQSTPGMGTTFTLYLPVYRHDAAPASETVGTRRVLVVDGDEAIRTVAARVLRRAGFEVQEVAAADAALALLDAVAADAEGAPGAPDVVLGDIALPSASGRTFGELLRERHPRTRVVFTSSCPDDAPGGARAAGDAVLLKPFAPSELEAAVRAVLRNNIRTNE